MIESFVAIILSLIGIIISSLLDGSKTSCRKTNVHKASNILHNGNNKQQNGVIRRKGEEVDTFKYSESLRTILLFVYILINGLELGDKLVNRQLIFLMNYCEVISEEDDEFQEFKETD